MPLLREHYVKVARSMKERADDAETLEERNRSLRHWDSAVQDLCTIDNPRREMYAAGLALVIVAVFALIAW